MLRQRSRTCSTDGPPMVFDDPQKKDESIHVVLRPRRHVVFDESVIDNEFAGKKSSKICCIYRKKRVFGEDSDSDSSSSSSSSSCCSSSSSSSDNDGSDNPIDQNHDRKESGESENPDKPQCNHDHQQQRHHSRHHHHHHQRSRKNAYERQPHYKKHTKLKK